MKIDNGLIAEFMGGVPSKENSSVFLMTKDVGRFKSDVYKIREMEFDSSWDWLMPVVDRIDGIDGCDFEMYPAYKSLINGRSGVGIKINLSDGANIVVLPNERNRIEVCYKAVVEFIKWYNDQNK